MELFSGGMGVLMEVVVIVSGILFAFLYSRERDRSRDYATELSNLIHKYDLDSRDLRRSLRHKEIRNQVEKNYE